MATPDPAPVDRARVRSFVLMLGWVSLFADLCYEGMRAAVGPYLALMGASATVVGLISGSGEAIGYALRYVTGALADRTGRYWALTFAGYATNLVAVPLLALAPSWPMIAVLVAVERLGKAVRSPAKSTITSFAAAGMGAGKVFAITAAMDRVGGMLGPLTVAAVLAWRGESAEGFAWAFALLSIPAVMSLVMLTRARQLVPDPRSLDSAPADERQTLGPRYRIYLVGIAAIAIGLADWPLVAFHLQREQVLATRWIPVAYAAAMAADGVTSLVAGWSFDRARARGRTGAGVVSAFVIAGACYAPLVFLASPSAVWLAVAGIALWSIARAATESVGKALIATIVTPSQRGRAYGLYYLVWGVAWWLGSVALGVLYDWRPAVASGFATGSLVVGAVIVALSGSATSRGPRSS